MAAPPVSPKEYLGTNDSPACEYVDGVLIPRAMLTWDHAWVQARILQLVNNNYPGFLALGEIHCKIRDNYYLVPDVAIFDRSKPQRPYPTKPVVACVEILSPEDRIGQTLAKCEEYHAWGVLYCWVINPERKTAWIYCKGTEPNRIDGFGTLVAENIQITMAALFDEAA